VTERPHLGFSLARSAAAEVNYSCVQIGHYILRRRPITGGVQRGNLVTHSVAGATRDWCFDSGRPAERNAILSIEAPHFHIAARRRGGAGFRTYQDCER